MSTLTAGTTAQLIADYPTTSNPDLARRYNLTAGQVARIGHVHGLRKTDDYHLSRLRAAVIRGVAAQEPAVFPATFPVYPAADYCAGCGLSNRHDFGCAGHKRSTSPIWRGTGP